MEVRSLDSVAPSLNGWGILKIFQYYITHIMKKCTAVETARVVSHLPNFFRKAMTQLMQEEVHKELSTLEQVDINQVLPNPDPL